MDGQPCLFLVAARYGKINIDDGRNCRNETDFHTEKISLAGPNEKDALEKAGQLLRETHFGYRPEYCKVFQALPWDYNDLFDEWGRTYRKRGGIPPKDVVLNRLFSLEDERQHSPLERLEPVTIVYPDFVPCKGETFMNDLLMQIHGIIQDMGCLVYRKGYENYRSTMNLKGLPERFVPEDNLLRGVRECVFENRYENGKTWTVVQAGDIRKATMEELQSYLKVLRECQKLHFTGKIKGTSLGEYNLSLQGPKRYKVVLHYEVVYAEEVEAASEDEAIEKVQELAGKAPSSDFEWLEYDQEVTALDSPHGQGSPQPENPAPVDIDAADNWFSRLPVKAKKWLIEKEEDDDGDDGPEAAWKRMEPTRREAIRQDYQAIFEENDMKEFDGPFKVGFVWEGRRYEFPVPLDGLDLKQDEDTWFYSKDEGTDEEGLPVTFEVWGSHDIFGNIRTSGPCIVTLSGETTACLGVNVIVDHNVVDQIDDVDIL